MAKIVVEQPLTEEALGKIVEQELAGLTVPLVVEIRAPNTLKGILARQNNIRGLTEVDVAQSTMRVLKNIHGLGTFPQVVDCQFRFKSLEEPNTISIVLEVRIVPQLVDPIDIPGPDNPANPDPVRLGLL